MRTISRIDYLDSGLSRPAAYLPSARNSHYGFVQGEPGARGHFDDNQDSCRQPCPGSLLPLGPARKNLLENYPGGDYNRRRTGLRLGPQKNSD